MLSGLTGQTDAERHPYLPSRIVRSVADLIDELGSRGPGSSARLYVPCRSACCAIMPILSVAAMFSFVASCSFAILRPVSVAEADDGQQARRPAFS